LEATLQRLITLALAVCMISMLGIAASVGVVSSPGDFRVDGSQIRGNGTVFEGSVIETASARSTVQLGDVQVTLLPDSRLKAYKGRAVLEKGWGVVNRGTMEAASFQIAPSKGSSAVVQMTAPKSVNVVAQAGDTQVRTAQGVLVASVRAGMGMAFTAQANTTPASANQVMLAGLVGFADNKCTITESSTSPVTYEVQGWPACQATAKKYVKIRGALKSSQPPVVQADPTTAAVIKSDEAMKIAAAGTGAAAVGVAAGIAGTTVAVAGAAAGAAVATGLSTVAVAGIVGGAATAATIGGLAAAGTIGGSSSPR
jgi:hypothetical protein